ncbi:MAG: PTS sugar transporter subunit IIA [Planctomycetota bacterium]
MAALSMLLDPERVLHLVGGSRDELLSSLCAGAAPLVGVDEGRLLAAVREREELSSTGFGDGLAMPHVRLPDVSRVQVVLARAREGVEYGALDGGPVRLLLLVVGPESDRSAYQKVMARAARFLKGEGARLLGASDDELAVAALAASEPY